MTLRTAQLPKARVVIPRNRFINGFNRLIGAAFALLSRKILAIDVTYPIAARAVTGRVSELSTLPCIPRLTALYSPPRPLQSRGALHTARAQRFSRQVEQKPDTRDESPVAPPKTALAESSRLLDLLLEALPSSITAMMVAKLSSTSTTSDT
jgi:hypothetical protein